MSADDDTWYVHKVGDRRFALTRGRVYLGVLDRNTGVFVPDAHQVLSPETIEMFANEVRRRIVDSQKCIFGG